MAKIRYEERVFDLAERFTFAEIDYIERLTKTPLDELSSMSTIRATIFLSIRRADPGFLSWKGMGEVGLEDFTFLDDEGDEVTPEEAEEADPLDEKTLAIAAGLPGVIIGEVIAEVPGDSSEKPATNESSS